MSKKWLRPLFRVFARGWRRASAPILRSRAGGEPPLPYCAPAPGRLYAEKQRKYGRPDTGPKKVWPSGFPTAKTLDCLPKLDGIFREWETLVCQDLTQQEQQMMSAMLDKIKIRSAQWMDGR